MMSQKEFVELMNTIRKEYGLPLLGEGDETAGLDKFEFEDMGVLEDLEKTWKKPEPRIDL